MGRASRDGASEEEGGGGGASHSEEGGASERLQARGCKQARGGGGEGSGGAQARGGGTSLPPFAGDAHGGQAFFRVVVLRRGRERGRRRGGEGEEEGRGEGEEQFLVIILTALIPAIQRRIYELKAISITPAIRSLPPPSLPRLRACARSVKRCGLWTPARGGM
jgi:hypothetical protein